MYIGTARTVLGQVQERLAEIHLQNREPEYIALTRAEYDAMRNDCRSPSVFAFAPDLRCSQKEAAAQAVFKTREFRRTRASIHRHDPDRVVVPQQGSLYGVPLFVVPDEFMPH